MEKGRKAVVEVFGNRLRVRVCGICVEGGKLLLVNHRGINAENEFWSPPGGGMEFGYSAEENLAREFKEETGLDVKVEEFLCVNEFIGPPLHAVELFFKVRIVGGNLVTGTEPELSGMIEIIKEVKFQPWQWIESQAPRVLHNLLHDLKSPEDLLNTGGYFLQKKNK